jgi:predicted Rossmann fold nucleotide-binding protein DprA/Smf involved in DNA uptake
MLQDKNFPAILQERFPGGAPPVISAIGNPDILTGRKSPWTALLCSKDCPGSVILPALDHVRGLRDAGRIVVSGFHSPMEQECFKLLLRGTQSIIICPARAISKMRLPAEWQRPLAENRLLILSPFEENQKRMTAALARERNAFVAALADEIFVVYGRPNGSSFDLARQALDTGKKVYTIDGPANLELLTLGVQPLSQQGGPG